MAGQQPCRAHLVVPRKPARAVRRELYIIRRISVDKISRLEFQCLNIPIAERPLPKQPRILREISRIVDRFVSAERHIEIATLVETTQTVETGAIQVVEQLRAFLTVRLAIANQLIEALAVLIEEFLVIAHREAHLQAVLHVAIEVNQVGIDVVQQRRSRLQSQHNRKPTAKRFDVPAGCVFFPDRLELRD